MTANSIDGMCAMHEQPSAYPKFVGSSIANVGLSLWKDRRFTRMFGINNKIFFDFN
jgi:hypothetical protein